MDKEILPNGYSQREICLRILEAMEKASITQDDGGVEYPYRSAEERASVVRDCGGNAADYPTWYENAAFYQEILIKC